MLPFLQSALQNVPSALVAAVVAVALSSGYTDLQFSIIIVLAVLAVVILLSAIPWWKLGRTNGFDGTVRVGIVKRFSDRNGWGVISCDGEDADQPDEQRKQTKKPAVDRNDIRFYREDLQTVGLNAGSTVSFNTVNDPDAPGWLKAINIQIIKVNGDMPTQIGLSGPGYKEPSSKGIHKKTTASKGAGSSRRPPPRLSGTALSKPGRKAEPEKFEICSPSAQILNVATTPQNSRQLLRTSKTVRPFSTQLLTLNLSSGEPVGLKVLVLEDESPGGLLVVDSATEGPGIHAGDIIVQVGETRGAAREMLNLLEQAAESGGELNLLIQPRPSTFEVELHRTGPSWDKLGLSVGIDKKNPSCMIVRAVREEGLAADWNIAHGTSRICSGDRIDQVNECRGDAMEMNVEIQRSGEGSVLRLQVVTPWDRSVQAEQLTGSQGTAGNGDVSMPAKPSE